MDNPIIKLPEDPNMRGALEKKLAEYVERATCLIRRYPEIEFDELNRFNPSVYKLAILEKLLRDGEINTDRFLVELQMKKHDIDPGFYQDSAFVIRDYCETGGENVIGGTGLPLPGHEEEWRIMKEYVLKIYSEGDIL